MADPKRPTLKLVEIDENYEPPAGATATELQKGAYAKAMREGVTRSTKRNEAKIEGLKLAQTEELNRVGKLVSRAAHRDGVLQGTVLGSLLVALLCFGAWIILKETVLLNTATQRVNYPNPPTITDTYDGAVTYERNPREPRDAP
tara:strand:+ start:998 stop:1432 length:435 start_codon:yes stop_codon:yes gene_type:complete